MCRFRYSGRHAKHAARLWWRPWVLLACAWLPSAGWASCLVDPDTEIAHLQELIAVDATKALKQAIAALDALKRQPLPDAARNTARMASLYAVEAEAYGILELDSDARRIAAKGLALIPGHGWVHLELLAVYADNVYDKAGIAGAIEAIEAARTVQPRGSTADTCLLITRGLLEHRLDREDLAIVTLTQAYRASIAPAVTEPHIMSADYLSLVMRSMGDYSQALTLNQEKIDWDTEHERHDEPVGVAFHARPDPEIDGQLQRGDHEFTQARQLSVSLADPQGVAFADQRICEAHIELGELVPAAARMRGRAAHIQHANSTDSVKETQALQARIDLGSGHPDRALATMNQVLDHRGADVPPRLVALDVPLARARERRAATITAMPTAICRST